MVRRQGGDEEEGELLARALFLFGRFRDLDEAACECSFRNTKYAQDLKTVCAQRCTHMLDSVKGESKIRGRGKGKKERKE